MSEVATSLGGGRRKVFKNNNANANPVEQMPVNWGEGCHCNRAGSLSGIVFFLLGTTEGNPKEKVHLLNGFLLLDC